MDIRTKVERLAARMHGAPQYPTQGRVLFVDLERQTFFSRYLGLEVLRTLLTNRGAEATGAGGMSLATERTNATAQRLYESLGWRRDEEFLHYELEVPPR